MMIGFRWPAARRARTVEMPSSSGISMSMVTRSGASCSTLPSARRPLAATPTTSMAGSAPSAWVTRRRTTTESSTTSTRTVIGAASSRAWVWWGWSLGAARSSVGEARAELAQLVGQPVGLGEGASDLLDGHARHAAGGGEPRHGAGALPGAGGGLLDRAGHLVGRRGLLLDRRGDRALVGVDRGDDRR